MIDTKLIMLEGLPGTGKSTNSHFLSMQLALEGKTVKWFHEVARPHPVLFFSEACLTVEEYRSFLKAYPQSEPVLNQIAVFRKASVALDLLELEWNYFNEIGTDALIALQAHDVWTFPLDRYAEVALEKWAFFAEKALENDEVSILDSAVFQFQIFTFLLKAAPAEKTERFILKLLEIVKPLNPSLIYFYRENACDTVDFLEKLRGTEFLRGIWERDKAEPYYRDKPTGAEGHKRFLMDYAAIAEHIFDLANCRKLSVEITGQTWRTYEDELLSFLGVRRKPYSDALPPNGVFRNEAFALDIEINGLMMKDPYGKERPLTPKSDCEFYVDCLPVVLYYNGLDRIKVSGGQICERWTTSGTEFVRRSEMNITIKPLTPELSDAYFDFFENRAFTDDSPYRCYCQMYQMTKAQAQAALDNAKGQDPGQAARDIAERQIKSGILRGYLAFADGVAIGWCNANDKANYPVQSCTGESFWAPAEKREKAVVCFEIAPQFRGKGVATALLARAVADAKAEGCTAIEGFPVVRAERFEWDCKGPIRLYEKAGFARAAERDGVVVMRLELK